MKRWAPHFFSGLVLVGALVAVRVIRGEMPRQYDVGEGTVLRLLQTGRGSCTIVLEMPTDEKLRHQLSGIGRVIEYDRGGWNVSSIGDTRRNADQMARELNRALHLARADPPYLLVADGVGSWISRRFASLYPSQVQGMILCDPILEDSVPGESAEWLRGHDLESFQRLEERLAESGPQAGELLEWLRFLRAHHRREISMAIQQADEKSRESLRKVFENELYFAESVRETYSYLTSLHGAQKMEFQAFDLSFGELRSQPLPPNVPAIVLSSAHIDSQAGLDERQALAALQRVRWAEVNEWLRPYPTAVHRPAPHSNDDVQFSDREILLNAVRDLAHPPSRR